MRLLLQYLHDNDTEDLPTVIQVAPTQRIAKSLHAECLGILDHLGSLSDHRYISRIVFGSTDLPFDSSWEAVFVTTALYSCLSFSFVVRSMQFRKMRP